MRARAKTLVKAAEEFRCNVVINFPECSCDGARAGAEECASDARHPCDVGWVAAERSACREYNDWMASKREPGDDRGACDSGIFAGWREQQRTE